MSHVMMIVIALWEKCSERDMLEGRPPSSQQSSSAMDENNSLSSCNKVTAQSLGEYHVLEVSVIYVLLCGSSLHQISPDISARMKICMTPAVSCILITAFSPLSQRKEEGGRLSINSGNKSYERY